MFKRMHSNDVSFKADFEGGAALLDKNSMEHKFPNPGAKFMMAFFPILFVAAVTT